MEYARKKKVVKGIILKAKREFYRSKLDDVKTSREFYKLTDKLLGRNSETILPSKIPKSELPDIFGEYFNNKITNLRNGLDKVACDIEVQSFNGELFNSFRHVSTEDIKETLISCANKSCPLDPVPTEFVKMHVHDIVPHVAHIINTSLESGTVPDVYKVALVNPLIKKYNLDPEELKNYRPVSNLPFFSKVLEKLY